MVTGRCFRSKRLGVSCWTRGYAWRLHLQSVGVGHAIRPIAGLRAVSDEGGVFDVVVNVGGFGQTEELRRWCSLLLPTRSVHARLLLGWHASGYLRHIQLHASLPSGTYPHAGCCWRIRRLSVLSYAWIVGFLFTDPRDY